MSVLFNFLEKMVEQIVRNNIANLQRGIDSLFPRLSPEQTLIYIHDENRKTAVTMEGLAEQIGHRVQQAMSDATGRMLEGIVSGLKEVMSPAIQQLVDSSTNLADRQAQGGEHALESLIKQFSEGLRLQGEEQAGSLQVARDEFQQVMRDWCQSMNKWGEQHEVERGKMQHEMSQLAERLSGTTEAVANQVQKQVQTLQSQSEHLGGKLDQFVSNISSTVDAHVGATSAVISNSERLNGQVEHLGKELVTSTGILRQGAEELRSATGGLSQLSDRLNTAAEQLSGGLRDLTERVEQVTRQNAEAGGRLQDLVNGFTAVGDRLREVADTITDASKSANQQTQSLREHQDDLQNALRDHVGQMQEQVTTLLRDYGERVRGQTIERMDEWNKQTTEFSASMVNAVNAIAEVVDEIEAKVSS